MRGRGNRTDRTDRTNGTPDSGTGPATRGESCPSYRSYRSDAPADSPGFIPPHGGYRDLLSYRKAEIVYDATVRFCRRFLDRRDRTIDQMVQAARSGKQNIAEGSQASGTSREMEIKLTNVARASLEELLRDYHDYLRSHDLPLWDKDSRAARAVRRLGRQDDESFETYRHYVEERSDGTVANMVICLIHQANYLLDRQLRRLERDFLDQGGMREQMTRARIDRRRQQGLREDGGAYGAGGEEGNRTYRTNGTNRTEEQEPRPQQPRSAGGAKPSCTSYAAAQPTDGSTDHRTDRTDRTDRTEDQNRRPQQPRSAGGAKPSYASYMSYTSYAAAQYRPYPAYKPSGVEWLGDVPEHWQSKTVRHLLSYHDGMKIGPFGSQLKLDGMVADGYKVYGQQNVLRQDFQLGSRFIDEAKFQELCACEIRPGDVVVTMMGSSGSFMIVPEGISQGIMDSHLLRIRFSQSLLPRFAIWVMGHSSHTQAQIAVLGKGAIMHGLNSGIIRQLMVALPPIPEQRAIADFLDRETGRIDALIAKKRRLIELLEEKRSALISHAVTKGLDPNAPMKDSGIEWLGQIPAHWVVKKLGFVSRIGNGSTPSRDNSSYWIDGDYPWLNSSVVNHRPVEAAEQFVTPLALRECHLPIVQPKSVLVGITGQGKTRGMSTVLTYEATINQHMAYITPHERAATADFLCWGLTAAYSILRDISDGSGSTKGALTCEQLGQFRLAMPPLPEQEAITNKLQWLTGDIDALISKNRDVIDKLQEYRTALISAAVTGKIDVREEVGPVP